MPRAQARIDSGAIRRNIERLASAAPSAAVCAVVKADGYGHGWRTAAVAARAAGAQWLAVASAAEALSLRESGDRGQVLLLGAIAPDELETALLADVDISVWDPAFAAALPDTARVHVKLDTGLGRLGTRDPRAATRIAEALAGRSMLRGLWTHFATADELGDDFFALQLGRFREWALPLRARFPEVLLHAANSAALLREPDSHFDVVRCGVAIYGLDPYGVDPRPQRLEPALALRSYVAAVKTAASGDSLGYGRRFVADRQLQVATVPIGYGDGVRRGLSGNAAVLVGGRRRQVLGTISMDNITIEGDGCEVGDEVVLIGRQGDETVLAEEWAERLGTINYEITCGISQRVPRIQEPG